MNLPEIHPLIVVGVTISILVTLGTLVAKVAQLFTKYNLVEKVDVKTDEIIHRLADIGAKVDLIFSKGYLSFAKRQSPISLTQHGLEIFKELEIETLIEKHWPEWESRIRLQLAEREKAGKASNAYDIQQLCFELFKRFTELLTEAEVALIKEHAFKNGIDLILYDALFQIPVRDRILETLNLSIDDIEEYKPTNSSE